MRVIHSVDRNVGRVLKYLEENGLMGNTMSVYTSDQVFYMGEHGLFDKRFMYEEDVYKRQRQKRVWHKWMRKKFIV